MNARLKRVLHWASVLLCIVAILFFAREISDAGLLLPPDGMLRAIGLLLCAALVYAGCVGLLAFSWSDLVLGRRPPRRMRGEVIGSYLISQFGKYIPGNVFQYVGRHALGRRLGIPHSTLASAAIFELGFLLALTALVSAAFAPRFFDNGAWLRQLLAMLGCMALMGMIVVPRMVDGFPRRLRLEPVRFLLLASSYFAFVVIFGLLYSTCLWIFGASVPTQDSIGSAAFGWMLGFIVPGAPAGAGLREAALALTQDRGESSASVMSAIIAFRVVTMAGDFIAFLVGLGVRHLLGQPDGQTRPIATGETAVADIRPHTHDPSAGPT